MKNLLCLLLALILVMSIVFAASAASFEIQSSIGFVGISAEYEVETDNKEEIEAGTEGTIYALTLSWRQNGRIVYNAGKTTYTWNQGKLEYDKTVSDKGWTAADANVVFTAVNRSNRAVEITCGDPIAFSGLTITGEYSPGACFTVDSAATGGFEAAGKEQTGGTTYSITKVEGDSWDGTGNIGTITVTIAGK